MGLDVEEVVAHVHRQVLFEGVQIQQLALETLTCSEPRVN